MVDITRVEVHFSDENGAEAGGVDKRCLLEVRTAHRQPVALGHTDETLEKALDGAAKKMHRLLESTLGRSHDHKGGEFDPEGRDLLNCVPSAIMRDRTLARRSTLSLRANPGG